MTKDEIITEFLAFVKTQPYMDWGLTVISYDDKSFLGYRIFDSRIDGNDYDVEIWDDGGEHLQWCAWRTGGYLFEQVEWLETVEKRREVYMSCMTSIQEEFEHDKKTRELVNNPATKNGK